MANYEEYVTSAKQLMSFATISGKHPSVRTVGFGHDIKEPGVFYIVTQPGSVKLSQIECNENVAFTTYPDEGGRRMSSNRATARVSDKPFSEIAYLFEDNKGWQMGHPHPEEEVIIEMKVRSMLLESFVEKPEVIEF